MAKVNSAFQGFEFSTPEDLQCENNNKIKKMCCNPHCERPAFMCDEECEMCDKDDHKYCNMSLLSGLTNHLNKGVMQHRYFGEKLCEEENKLIDSIHRKSLELINKNRFSDFQ